MRHTISTETALREGLASALPQDRDFLAKQKEDLELAMKRITADNRREICDKERACLTRKQELLRGGCPRAGRVWAQNLSVGIPASGKKELLGLLHPKTKCHRSR